MRPHLRLVTASALVFVLALVIRGLYLSDGVALLYTPEQDGVRMARRYDESALSILNGDGILFPRVWDPARTGLASRPPGYAVFLASVYSTLGRSFPIVAAVQDILTSLAAVLVLWLGYRQKGLLIGVVAGLLVAISPHAAATSNLILADAIAPIPLLLAFWVAFPVIQAHQSSREQVIRLAAMGALIGLGVWIRPNLILLGPFSSVCLFFLLGRNRRAILVASVVAFSSLLVVAPITLRNWMVFGEFVPVSINGGITLWHGVGDAGGWEYGARVRDKQVMAEEAERYGRPDYQFWWAEPEGIARDRDRYRRALDVIKAKPLWYASAMARRVWLMLCFTDGPSELLPAGFAREATQVDRVPLPTAPGLDAAVDEDAFAERAGLASILRGPLRLIHQGWFVVPALCWIGIALSIRESPRSTWVWLIVPAYYLIFESPFLYEWRVAVPMQYFLLPFAAGPLSGLLTRLGRWFPIRRRMAGHF